MKYQKIMSIMNIKLKTLIWNIIENGRDIKDAHYIFIGLAVSILLYPQILWGEFFIAGSDLLFNHFPNLLWGHRVFQDYFELGIWNPNIFMGADFSLSMHAHHLNPLYWPLFLINEAYIFHAISIFHVLINISIFYIWVKIGHHFNLKYLNSVILGISAQAGLFFWAMMTTFIGVPMYLFSSLAILMIFTSAGRGTAAQYFILTGCFFGIFITPHPAYIIGFSAPVIGVFILEFMKDRTTRFRLSAVIALAIFSAILFSSYRLVPVFLDLLSRGDLTTYFGIAHGDFLFSATLFNPMALGVNLGESMGISSLLGSPGRHIQIHNALYFGLVPLYLVIQSLKHKDIPTIFLSLLFLLTLSGYINISDPLSYLAEMLIFPFNHGAIWRIFSAFIFLFLLIRALVVFQNLSCEQVIRYSRGMTLVSFSVFILYISQYAIIFESSINYFSIDFDYGFWIRHSLRAFAAVLLMFVVTAYLSGDFFKNEFSIAKYLLFISLLVFSAFNILTLYILSDFDLLGWASADYSTVRGYIAIACSTLLAFTIMKNDKIRAYQILGAFVIFVASFLHFVDAPRIEPELRAIWNLVVGWTNFFLVWTVICYCFLALSKNTASRSNLVFVMVFILSVDLIAAHRNYTYSNIAGTTPHFQSNSEAYTGVQLKDLVASMRALNTPQADTVQYGDGGIENFRTNHVAMLAGHFTNDVMSAFSAVYNMKTYGGVDSVVPENLVEFISEFQPDRSVWFHRAGIISNLSNTRLLDLLGVRFDLGEQSNLIEREGALTRLLAYENVLFVEPDNLYEVLRSVDFNPQTQVVTTSEQTTTQSALAYGGTPSLPLEYNQPSNDTLIARIPEGYGRFILFNERYSRNWQAFWNGEEISIHDANGFAMLIEIPGGDGELTLKFYPALFWKLFLLSMLALVIYIIMIITHLLRQYFVLSKSVKNV